MYSPLAFKFFFLFYLKTFLFPTNKKIKTKLKTKKKKKIMSKKTIEIQDELNLSSDSSINYILQKNEKIYFSTLALKINKKARITKETLILTNHRLISLNKKENFIINFFFSSKIIKREFYLKNIEAITYSIYSNNFILHSPSKIDYLLSCVKKDDLILYILKLLKNLGKNSLPIFKIENIDLRKFFQMENDNKTKWPKQKYIEICDEKKFILYINEKKKELEINIKNTEIIMTYKNEKVNENSFEILSQIGKGFYGKVFLVSKKDTKKLYALKVISKLQTIKNKFFKQLQNEKKILEKIDNPFVVKREYCFASPSYVFFAMEFKQGGNLYHHIKKKKFNESTTKFYAAQILYALAYLHSNNIIYRDVKPENILLDKKGNSCIADFGISKIMNINSKTTTFVGTPQYVAPEIIMGRAHGKAVDIWSYGILLYEMIFGYTPFYHKNENIIMNRIVKKNFVFDKEIEITDELGDLILRVR